jgi:hypothetical protein
MIYIRLKSADSASITASDGNLYRMSGPGCLPVCVLDLFLAPGLIARLGGIPKNISSQKIEYKPRTSSSANFTGRRDYLKKFRDDFSVKPDEPLRRKPFLLYGMGDIGKAQNCSDL